MTVGEVIAALCVYASKEDDLLMCKSICAIEVVGNNIELSFTDVNTANYAIEVEI